MTYRDIDMNISPETKTMPEEVKKFSMDVMRPAGIELDALPDPGDVIAKNSLLWDVFKGFHELGLHTMQITKTMGGDGRRSRTHGWSTDCRTARLCRYSADTAWQKNSPLKRCFAMQGQA